MTNEQILKKAITKAVFQKTGVGELFGMSMSDIERMFEGPAGKIKEAGDYHGDKVGKEIRSAANYHVGVLRGGVVGGRGSVGVGGLSGTMNALSNFGGFLNGHIRKSCILPVGEFSKDVSPRPHYMHLHPCDTRAFSFRGYNCCG